MAAGLETWNVRDFTPMDRFWMRFRLGNLSLHSWFHSDLSTITRCDSNPSELNRVFFALNDDVRTPLSYELQKDLKFSLESSGFNLHTDMFESFLSLQIQTLLRNSMRCRDVFVPICFIPPSIRDEAGRPTASITSRLLLLILSQDEELKQWIRSKFRLSDFQSDAAESEPQLSQDRQQ